MVKSTQRERATSALHSPPLGVRALARCSLTTTGDATASRKEPERKVVSLHSIETGKRLTQSANPKDIKFLTYNTWRTNWAG